MQAAPCRGFNCSSPDFSREFFLFFFNTKQNGSQINNNNMRRAHKERRIWKYQASNNKLEARSEANVKQCGEFNSSKRFDFSFASYTFPSPDRFDGLKPPTTHEFPTRIASGAFLSSKTVERCRQLTPCAHAISSIFEQNSSGVYWFVILLLPSSLLFLSFFRFHLVSVIFHLIRKANAHQEAFSSTQLHIYIGRAICATLPTKCV